MRKPDLPELERTARALARKINRDVPEGAGFCLLLFNLGEGGWTTYLSNANRADMLKALREFIARVERDGADA